MSLLSFGLPKPQTDLGSALVLDVLQDEEFELPGEVTLYPTEAGSEISDHVFTAAKRLRIRGVVSSSALFDFSLGSVSTRHADAIEALEGLRAKRQTFEVSTGMRLYPDMAFANLRFSRKGEGQGNWLHVEAEMVQVTVVKLREADVPERAAAPSARGRAGRTATPAGRTSDSGAGATTGAPNGPGQTPMSNIMQGGISQAPERAGDYLRSLLPGSPR